MGGQGRAQANPDGGQGSKVHSPWFIPWLFLEHPRYARPRASPGHTHNREPVPVFTEVAVRWHRQTDDK